MTNATTHQDLGERIERLVQEHIAASRRAAEEAVERAFRSTGGKAASQRPSAKRSGGSKRRASAELASLGERLYEAVCAKPGEKMMVLAVDVGGSARELHRPMAQLRRARRVRAVGARHATRYFPMA